MPYFVYVITNQVNGKRYVGKTNDPDLRWRDHRRDAKRGSRYLIHRAMRKHGLDAFSFEVVTEYPSDSEALLGEVRLISELKTFHRHGGYNMTLGGEGCARQEEWVDEETFRQKIQGVTQEYYKANLKSFGYGFPSQGELKRVYGKTFAEIRDGVRGDYHAWVPVEQLRVRIQGMTLEQYEAARVGWGPGYPSHGLFVEEYGNTFAGIRDGVRRVPGQQYVDVETMRDRIRGVDVREYEAARACGALGPEFPHSARFRFIYMDADGRGMAYGQVRDGVRRPPRKPRVQRFCRGYGDVEGSCGKALSKNTTDSSLCSRCASKKAWAEGKMRRAA